MTHPQLPDETESLVAGVPPHLLEGLRGYAVDHRPVGGFLTAVLENDLMRAVVTADVDSLACLLGIVHYVYNALPSGCHGSPEKVKAWLERKDRQHE